MKAIKKSLCFALAVLSAVFTARAVDPVAVWSGDLGTEKAGFAFALNDNTLNADGTITMSAISDAAKLGVTLRSTTAAYSASTIIFEVEGMSIPSADGAAIVSTYSSSSGYDDYCGMRVTNSGETYGIWNNNKWGGTNNCQTHRVNSAAELGAATRVALVYVQDKSKGTQGYMMINGTLTKIFGATGLVSTTAGMGAKGWNLLGAGCATTANNSVAKMVGAKLKKVAIFNSDLSTDAIAAYEFPNPDEIVLFDSTTQLNYNVKTRISPDTSITMEQLRASTFSGKIGGGWMPAGGIATRCVLINEAASTDDKLVIQLQVFDDREATHYIKFANVELTVESDGVYAKHIHRGYVQTQTDENIGTLQTGGTSLDNQAADVYAVIALKATWEKPAPSAETLPLLYCYHLEGDAANSGTGTVAIATTGTPTWENSKGKFGSKSVKVNSGTYKLIDSNGIGKTTGWTLSMWLNPNGEGGWNDFGGFDLGTMKFKFEKKGGGNTGIALYHRKPDNSGDIETATLTVSNNADEWIQVTVTSTEDGGIKVYQNGVLKATYTPVSGDVTGSGLTAVYIGKDGLHDGRASNGLIDEVAVYGTVLTSAQIAYLQENAPDNMLSEGPAVPTAEVADMMTWDDLIWDTEPKSGKPVKLNVTKDATLTIDQNLDYSKIVVAGTGNLTIDDTEGFTVPAIDANGLTGTVTIKSPIVITVNAGSHNLTYIYTGAGEISSAITTTGSLTLNAGNGTISGLDFGDNYTGQVTISGGVVSTTKLKAFGATPHVMVNYPAIWEIKTTGQINDTAVNCTGVTGNGTIRYFGADWHTLPYSANMWASTLGFQSEVGGGGAILPEPDKTVEIGSLSGSKGFRSDFSTGNRNLRVTQTHNTTWSGTFTNNDRVGTLFVAGAQGVTEKTLTIAGTHDEDNSLEVEATGSVNLSGTWKGNVTVNGEIGGNGSVRDASAITFNAGSTIRADWGVLTVTGTLTLPSQINLAVANPTHGMTVLNVPSSFTATTCKALVGDKLCDLYLEGTALKLKWKIPPMITVGADDVTIETADDWNGGVVTIGLGGLKAGDYEDDLRFLLRFGDKVVTGSAQDASASFNLDPSYFTAGNIYRGTFELEYGTSNEPIVAAEVTVYAGEKTYGTKEGWINETTKTFASTGSYDPEQGATFDDSFIKFSNPTDVVFTPTNSPADYVAKCDSTVTFEIFSGEEAIQDDDDTVAADLQAGVKIVDDGSGGVKFQFISGNEWIGGPAAALNTTYEVTVNFHYAKEAGDTDSVTYTVGETVQPCARRANVAEKLETISFADGTQIASLTGTCQIEVANPVEKETGLAPGADGKELKATNEDDAQTEAKKIPVVVPSEVVGGLTEGLSADAAAAAKVAYTTNFTVVAQKNASGKFVAIVVPTEKAEVAARKGADELVEDVLTKVMAIPAGETEGKASIDSAIPGFFYGVAETNAVIHMQATEPSEWKMAGASGKVELKVTKPANAKARFYKIICSPLPKSAK